MVNRYTRKNEDHWRKKFSCTQLFIFSVLSKCIPYNHILLYDKWHVTSKQNVWSEVTQLCPTLCDPTDCSSPGSSVHGIFQAWILEWVFVSLSRGSSWPRDRTWVSRVVDRRFTVWATREAHNRMYKPYKFFFLPLKNPFPFKKSKENLVLLPSSVILGKKWTYLCICFSIYKTKKMD